MRAEVRKIAVKRLIRDEKGQALILALILLVVGGLIITSLLGLMNTGLITGQVYENKMHELYAADAGVEDALWKMKNIELVGFLYGYDDYNYFTVYPYPYDVHVNDKAVNVTIENVWIPKDIPAPDATIARQIIEEGKLIIAGSPSLIGAQYEIKIGYDNACNGTANARVNRIGIWLPPGFEYVMGSSDLEKASGKPYYSAANVTPHKGGYAVIWDFVSSVLVKDFPKSFTFQYSGPEGQTPGAALSWIEIDADPYYTWDADVKVYKITSTATDPNTGTHTTVESYTSKIEPRKLGSAISGDYFATGATLMTPTGDEKYRDRLFNESSATIAAGDIPSNAIIEAAWLYWSGWIEGGEGGEVVVWSENCDRFDDPPIRWTAGNVWSTYNGRFRGTAYNKGSPGRYLTMSSSIDLSAYAGQTVEVSWEQYEDGSLEDSDRLYYAFSKDGGSTWSDNIEAFRDDNPPSSFSDTIPAEYLTSNFRMRFYLHGFSEGGWSQTEYCYIDNITISALTGSSVEGAKVNRVMFGTTGNMTQITTNQWQVEPTPDAGEQIGSTGGENSWSYSCYYDATDIFRAQLDPDTKSGIFTLGHVLEGSGYNLYPSGTTGYPLATPARSGGWSGYPTQYQWTYAGWSLLIIYSSPETKGHQLYLFDTFHYVGLDTLVTFSISNFLAPDDTTGSHLTYFVGEGDEFYDNDYIKVNGYNLPQPNDPYEPKPPVNPQNNVFNSYSNSLDNPYLSGIDIDTFDVSKCISPGDNSAGVVLDNGEEIYNLIYIILSFRSEITSGGMISYLIS
jgi:hypothetical protein